jgi:hypothetical protein
MSETSPMMDHSRTFFNDTPSFSRAKQIIIPKTVPFDDDSKHLHRRKNKERATTIQLQVEIENQLGSKSNVKQMVSVSIKSIVRNIKLKRIILKSLGEKRREGSSNESKRKFKCEGIPWSDLV